MNYKTLTLSPERYKRAGNFDLPIEVEKDYYNEIEIGDELKILIDSDDQIRNVGDFVYVTNKVVMNGTYLIELSRETNDSVNHPSHYTNGDIETIDYMESMSSEEEFSGYLNLNIIKYLSRYKLKNGLEDLKKAKWYLNKLIEVTDK